MPHILRYGLIASLLLAALTACQPDPTSMPQEEAMPTETPVPIATPIPPPPLIGAYWYPWYSPERHWQSGYIGTPVLGEYDSAASDVIAQQITWAQNSCVDFFVASWWGEDSFEDNVIKGAFSETLDGQQLQFAILYESPGLLTRNESGKFPMDDGANQTKLQSDARYLAHTYFEHPNYLHIDGKPVLFLYLTRTYTGGVDDAMDLLREAVEQEIGVTPYIIGDEVYWQSPSRLRMDPFDAVTAYNMHTSVVGIEKDFAQKVADQYVYWSDAAKRYKMGFVPSILPGFDDTAVRPEANHPVIPRSPELFEAQLQDALTLTTGKQPLITITSWNEWHEYTQIETAEEYGTQYLDILKAVCTE